MKYLVSAIVGSLVYVTLHLFLYSEPAILVTLLGAIWFAAELAEWDMGVAVWSILPPLVIASLETML